MRQTIKNSPFKEMSFSSYVPFFLSHLYRLSLSAWFNCCSVWYFPAQATTNKKFVIKLRHRTEKGHICILGIGLELV